MVRRILLLTIFAVSMANVEAALVVYLRDIYYADNPLALFPLNTLSERDLSIEIVREIATLIMIFCVAVLSEKDPVRKFAAFTYVFGIWDIAYYVWLRQMIGWPMTWIEWDVLFLIPWPWFGPWITPVVIAIVLSIWGSVVLLSDVSPQFRIWQIATLLLGIAAVLVAFLAPGAPLLAGGVAAFRGYVPGGFWWPLYGTGVILMVAGLPWRRS